MQPVPEPLLITTPTDEMVGRFARRDVVALPVVDVDGGYRGVVTAGELETTLGNDTFDITAGDLAHLANALAPDAPLDTALSQFVQQGTPALPVMDPRGSTILGWLTHRDILVAYQTRVESDRADTRRSQSPAVIQDPPRGTVS
jgi:CIC family chloride channel protein